MGQDSDKVAAREPEPDKLVKEAGADAGGFATA